MAYTVVMPSKSGPVTVSPTNVPKGEWFLGRIRDDKSRRLFHRPLGSIDTFEIFNEDGRQTYSQPAYMGEIHEYQPVDVEIVVKS